MEQGRVRKRGDKPFAHVSRSSGADVFVPPPTVQRLGLKDGDLIEFDVTDDPKKAGSFIAQNVRVINAAEPPAPSKPPELGVDFVWGNPYVTDIDLGGGVPKPQLMLPVSITVKQGKSDAVGIEVIMEPLRPEDSNIVHGPDFAKTTGNGRAFFLLMLPADATNHLATVRVEGYHYTGFWQKDQTASVTHAEPVAVNPEPKVAKAIRVFPLGVNEEGFSVFRVMTFANAEATDPYPVKGVVESAVVMEAKDYESPETDAPKVGNVFWFTTNQKAWNLVYLRPEKPGEAQIAFRLDDNPHVSAGPFTIRREPEPEPARPAGTAQPHFVVRASRTGANGTVVDFCLPHGTKGTVRVIACQRPRVNGVEVENVSQYSSDDNGHLSLLIELACDETVLFEHAESALQARRLLLKNRT